MSASESQLSEQAAGGISREEMMSALFAHMVMQQSNLAMMLLGKTPHPQTGESMQDLEAAKLFIDQLEMLAIKTKGNLTKQEEQLLKQSLMTLRLTFVEAMETPGQAAEAPKPVAEAPAGAAPAAESKPAPAPEPASASAEDESRKKFSKKY